jgi:RNA polymerase sigma factor (sigma-70 family)
LAAVPSIGRAHGIERATPREADLTRALYEQYAHQIFRFCLHRLGSREEAEDAVQSTFLNVFRGLKRGIVPELESAWLFKIAHNVCLSRRRSSWRRGRVESTADFDVVEELAAAPARREDELIGLQDALEQMPETQRRAILLREWQGLSYREIAEELELSQAAVETLIFRARRSLAKGLDEPPERRRRLAQVADVGNLATALKSVLLGGSAAAKVAAVAVVGATTVVAAEPAAHHPARHRALPAPASAAPERTLHPVRHAAAPARPVVASDAAVVVPAASEPARVPARHRRVVRAAHPVVHHAAPQVEQSSLEPTPHVVAPSTPSPPAAPAVAQPAPPAVAAPTPPAPPAAPAVQAPSAPTLPDVQAATASLLAAKAALLKSLPQPVAPQPPAVAMPVDPVSPVVPPMPGDALLGGGDD